MTRIDSTIFINELIAKSSELFALYKEHISDNEELLEHVFMGDVTRYIEGFYKLDSKNVEISKVIQLINSSFENGCESVKEIISVSFLENLTKGEESYVGIKYLLSNELQKELELYE